MPTVLSLQARCATKRRSIAAIALAMVVVVGGCETLDVRTDYDPGVDFAQYRTWSWASEDRAAKPETTPPGDEAIANPLVRQRARDAVERVLTAKGYRQAEPADFTVSVSVGVREQLRVRTWDPYAPGGRKTPAYGGRSGWQPWYDPSVQTYTEGILAIDIFDARTGRAAWYGSAVRPVDDEAGQAGPINEAVEAILAAFPPPQGR